MQHRVDIGERVFRTERFLAVTLAVGHKLHSKTVFALRHKLVSKIRFAGPAIETWQFTVGRIDVQREKVIHFLDRNGMALDDWPRAKDVLPRPSNLHTAPYADADVGICEHVS